MKKSFLYILIVDILLIAVVSILAFVIPYKHLNDASWITSYIFAVVSLLLFLVYAFFATKDNTLKSKVFGLSLLYVGGIYVALQLLTSFAVIVTNSFVAVQPWIPLLISLILLIFGCIGFVATKATTDIVKQIEDKAQNKTKTFDLIKAKSSALYSSIDDPEIKKLYYTLDEEIKYSDPVTLDEVASYEEEIEQRLQAIKLDISDKKSVDEISKSIDRLVDLVKERNLMVKNLKK